MGLTTTAQVLTLGSCVVSFIATVLYAVAFGTRRWLESKSDSPFVALGFHEICLEDCRQPYCPSGSYDKFYTGCWWLYDYYLHEIRSWVMTDWFVDCRVYAIVNMLLITVGFLVLCGCSALVMVQNFTTESHVVRDVVLLCLLYIAAALLLTATFLGIAMLSEFATNAYRLDWMPMPEKNGLGWSYWLGLTAIILVGLCALATTMAAIFKTMKMKNEKANKFSDDMMMGRRY